MSAARIARPAFARALNRGGRVIARGGVSLVRLDPVQLVADARRRTGLDDLGEGAIADPLARVARSLDAEAGLNLVGRIAARQDFLRLISSRLRIQEDRRRHPEIAAGQVRRPIFVTGLPRTGTTLLHGLLAQDPASRAPLGWEMMYPSPPPRPSLAGRDRRIAIAERQIRWFHRLAPDFRAIHPTGAMLPEECLVIASHSFVSFQFQTMYFVPGYQSWLEERDLTESYSWHRRFLQHLQWGWPERRWILKAPAHLFGLEALLRVYPDAGVVLTHRAPLEVVASLASLTTALRSTFSDAVDPIAVGAEMTRRWADGLGRALRARDEERVPARSVVDVLYTDLLRDPIGAVRAIYRSFDIELTAVAEGRMRAYLAANPKDRCGRHRYSLAEFGLDADEERERYGAYARRFAL